MVNAKLDRITIDPAVLGGKPCIRGLRISVGMIVQMVAAGKTADDILSEYPYLEAEDVRQALTYAAALAEHSREAVGGEASDRRLLAHRDSSTPASYRLAT